jgi:hypothetical protein
MAICFGFAASDFGSDIVRIPLWSDAVTLSASTSYGKVKLLEKEFASLSVL